MSLGRILIYGRIKMYVPSHKPRKMVNASATVAYFLPTYKPNWAYGNTHYLYYRSNKREFELYNPQNFKFELDYMKSLIVNVHNYQFNEVVRDFEILEVDVSRF